MPSQEMLAAGGRTLMRHRVQEILLVASPYDCYILEEDGRITEQIFSQYLELNLTSSPRIHQVSNWQEARSQLLRGQYDMVVTTPHISDMSPLQLAGAIKGIHPDLPIVMLTYDRMTAQSYADQGLSTGFDEVFLWTGDPRLLLVLVKSVEDRMNVEHDAQFGGVRVILVVEDSPNFYSSYLPLIYKEVLVHVKQCLSEVINESGRKYRVRARPKILMARTYEGAEALIEKYRGHLLGLVTDMRFPRGDTIDPTAGRRLIERVKREVPRLPILLQSAEPSHQLVATKQGVGFVDKKSPELLGQLRQFLWKEMRFGEFVFQDRSGEEIDRARDMQDMIRALTAAPADSLAYHFEEGHFSRWLRARCEYRLAEKVADEAGRVVTSSDDLRGHLIGSFIAFLEERQRGQITDFVRGVDLLRQDFTRLGRGYMGGKARGIAFSNFRLAKHLIHGRFPDVRIFVPRTIVICTEIFDEYCHRHGMRERALEAPDDDTVARLFLERPLGESLTRDLASILGGLRFPLAVRSSSLFEDSAFEPLAGLYRTVVVPNCSPDDSIRLEQLCRAIRLVWASTFFRGPLTYMEARSMRQEEEKMAVVIQRLVGSQHGSRFYPDFAGVAQSHNFYPIRYLEPQDGIATAALGLGQTVVDGGKALRFCPRHPEILPQMSDPRMALRTSQREFYALDLDDADLHIGPDDGATIKRFDLSVARQDGTLEAVGATYLPEEDQVYDTIHRPGTPIVNFCQVLKYGRFPLAPILIDLLEVGSGGLGTAVEMEFAVALEGARGRPEIAVLQLRPLVSQGIPEDIDIESLDAGETLLMKGRALGSGIIGDLRDIVYVHPDRFTASRTLEMAQEIGRINSMLVPQRRPYLLVAPGRWGTADPYLGIPVTWAQVSGARVVVELAVPGFRIDPSQGTHFFHNITSLRIGYFTVDLSRDDDVFDLDWLEGIAPEHEGAGVRHTALPMPLEVRIDASLGAGVAVLQSSRP